jgi:hypothetical protein
MTKISRVGAGPPANLPDPNNTAVRRGPEGQRQARSYSKRVCARARVLVLRTLAVILACEVFGHTPWAADPLTEAKKARIRGQKEAVESQHRVDDLSQQTQALLGEYRDVLQRTQELRAHNARLERLLKAQRDELDSLARQLDNVQRTQQQIEPLIERMVAVLERFVALDRPFLRKERGMRIASLKRLLNDPGVGLAEKYRRVMEAYQIEMDYGRTIEAYTGELERDKETRTVEFLRIGRIALIYRSLDARHCGYWDQAQRAWVALPASYNGAIARGLRIARKEAPPDLIEVPVSAPQAAP